MINDWAYFTKNLLLFWFGYLLLSRPSFGQLLTNQRRIFLIGTLLCTVALYAIRAMYDTEGPDILSWEIAYLIATDCLTWFSVLMSVAYRYRYLNTNHSILPYLTEAVYPFYILHQIVIVLIGYWVLKQTTLGVYDGFLFISFATLLVCVGIYWFLIRPFRITRVLFGVK